MILHIYDENFENIQREVKGEMTKVGFGTVKKLMALTKIEDVNDMTQVLGVVAGAWDDVTKLLERVFKDIETEEWDFVPLDDVLAAIVEIAKFTVVKVMSIPNDPNG